MNSAIPESSVPIAIRISIRSLIRAFIFFFYPQEFIPEFTADVGIKKGEKVDYAIAIAGKPLILVECKSVDDNFEKHGSQLFRYFGATDARFGILTNGILYKFYTDLDQQNKMDTAPFLVINLENIQDRDIAEIQKFTKSAIDVDSIISSAESLKYTKLIKDWFAHEIENPTADFVKLILASGVYNGRATQNIIDKFTPIVKKAISQYVNDNMNSRIKAALAKNDQAEKALEAESDTQDEGEEPESKIVITMEELEAFAIVKSILRKIVDSNRIVYKDTSSYFGILLDGNTRKWICRIYLKQSVSFITIAGENKKEERCDISALDDIYSYSDKILASCQRYLK